MTHASVFSGIGGPEVAATMLGWENKKAHFVAHSFEDFQPRKGFKCKQYFTNYD